MPSLTCQSPLATVQGLASEPLEKWSSKISLPGLVRAGLRSTPLAPKQSIRSSEVSFISGVNNITGAGELIVGATQGFASGRTKARLSDRRNTLRLMRLDILVYVTRESALELNASLACVRNRALADPAYRQ